LTFRPDVNTTCRLVGDQHLGPAREPLCEKHLLLVASGKASQRRLD
jgi:hypothetical protein